MQLEANAATIAREDAIATAPVATQSHDDSADGGVAAELLVEEETSQEEDDPSDLEAATPSEVPPWASIYSILGCMIREVGSTMTQYWTYPLLQ
jgi:hypothetical protein